MILKYKYCLLLFLCLIGCDTSYKFEYLFSSQYFERGYFHFIYIDNYDKTIDFYDLACHYRDTVSFHQPVYGITFLQSKKIMNTGGEEGKWNSRLKKDGIIQLFFDRNEVEKRDTCPSLESIRINKNFKGVLQLKKY